MKKLFVLLSFVFLFLGFSFAQNYIYFYWNWCSHCAKVGDFFQENEIESKYWVEKLEIYFDRDNLKTFSDYVEKLQIDQNKAWVPFLVIENENECEYIMWDKKIISFFQEKLDQDSLINCDWSSSGTCDHFDCNMENCPHLNCGEINQEDVSSPNISENINSDNNKRKFFGIMLPAALADSINPCAFAVMLLLLSSILTKSRNKKRALLSWLLFALAVFISYFAMWLWLFSALATATNTYIIKIIVWILWILVWLANLKDFFRYKKLFVMEVPLSWRPKMKKIISWATSPVWTFLIWFVVSLFLLPCTSWPYFTILWYLASESKNLHTWWYIYLLVYNLIFVLPMLFIAWLVWLWLKSAEQIASFKNKNSKIIHLIVWILMLGLWIYVLLSV